MAWSVPFASTTWTLVPDTAMSRPATPSVPSAVGRAGSVTRMTTRPADVAA